MRRSAAVLLAWLIAFPAAAQAVPGPRGGGWTPLTLEAAGRRLQASVPPGDGRGDILTVIIEGDGAAHDRRGRPTADPTPARATGFDIARAWPDGPVAWLGRLCQFEARRDPLCRPQDWTDGRFSGVALAAADAAVDQLKARAGARQVRLVGWSGGGVLATLVAGRRDDVAGLVTLAAPLDLAAWTQSQGLSPLTGSLNPADAPAMPNVPQAHLFGRYDPVVRPKTAMAAARRLGGPHAIVDVWPQKHGCCWARAAREIAAELRAASGLAAAVRNAADETAAEP